MRCARPSRAIVAALLLAIATPASAQARALKEDARATLMPLGSSTIVTLSHPEHGVFTVTGIVVEPPQVTSQFEQRAIASLPPPADKGELVGLLRHDTPVDPSLPPAPPLEPDHVRLTSKLAPDRIHTLLLIQNGYDRAIHFRSTLTGRDGKLAPPRQRAICPVAANSLSVENWPFPLARIGVHDFVFVSDDRTQWQCD